MDAHAFDPGEAVFNGPGQITIPWSLIFDLRLLADERSRPGAAVSVSDLVNEALASYVDKYEKALAATRAATEASELQRVAAVHGGEAA
jgi:hypothetical protein